MKSIFTFLIVLLPIILFSQTSIYDIQFTYDAGPDGWSYPSPYNGQVVTTGGIVTATDYLSNRYFIECSKGGEWSGLFVYDYSYSPSIGDSIVITGTVFEYQGYTEIKDLTSYSKISSGNPVPPTTKITTDKVDWEPYEGLLVEVNDCNISEVIGARGTFKINDGSGASEVSTNIYSLYNDKFSLIQDYPFQKIIGVVGVDNYERKLYPRSIDDFVSASNQFILSTEDKTVLTENVFSYPVKIGILNQSNTINSYSLKLQYDNSKFSYQGFSKIGTISESGTISDASSSGNIELNFSGDISSDNISTLVYLNFKALNEGRANLQFNSPTVNSSVVSYTSAGELEYSSGECDIPKADTLTVVQRPLLNIPSVVVPQQTMNIECFAPQATTDWNVELFFDDISIPIQVNQTSYDSNLDKWTLTTLISDVDLYELYDMRVTASGGLIDTVRNAVKVIDQFKDYYFIHITDTHLPGHTYYGNSGYETDHTELDDLYEVIQDINLLNPEFVLLTGDLLNEGEMEDFECLRHHTLAIQLLEKLEVPVFIVPGNHDLGGWDATPPSQGTARREWWRFFGWRQREIPPTKTEYLSHDYSFDYGDVHFTGLEAYDNYDSYMYDVYGAESFISSQLTWLNDDIAAAGNKTKVLFYHYDFKHELNLSNLGVDMALWGHTHSNYNNGTHPYNISTASVCDENRAYRVIRVNNGNLQAENTIYTHSTSDNLHLDYNMLNDGTLDSVSATVNNYHSQQFQNGLIKFNMPLSDYGYSVTNGNLKQIISKSTYAKCYVQVNIPSNNSIAVSVKRNLTEVTGIDQVKSGELKQNYPNPFNTKTKIPYTLNQPSLINISVYDSSGRFIKVLLDEQQDAGNYSVYWGGSNSNGSKVENGIYFYKLSINNKIVDYNQMIYIK